MDDVLVRLRQHLQVDPVTLVVLAPAFCMCLSLWHVYVLRRLPPGLLRVTLVVPWVVPFTLACHGKHHIVYTLANSFTNLAVGKVVAGALNRGPLQKEWSLMQVYAIVAFPISIQYRDPREGAPAAAIAAAATATTTAASAATTTATAAPSTRPAIPPSGSGPRKSASSSSGGGGGGSGSSRPRPVKQRHNPVGPTMREVQKLFASTAKAGGFMAISGMLEVRPIPSLVKHLLMGVSMYCVLGGLMDMFGTIAMVSYWLPTISGFVKPWQPASVADFWRKRWNAPAAHCMRWLVYDPIVEGSLVNTQASSGTPPHHSAPPPPQPSWAAPHTPSRGVAPQTPSRGVTPLARKGVGLAATFLASGLLSDLMYSMSSGRATPSWRWTSFFLLQAPLIWLERMLAAWLQAAHLPQRVQQLCCRGYAILALLGSAHLLFFPPCVEAPYACHVLTYSQMLE